MKGKEGFTLLEMVIALSIFAVIGIWAAGFLGSQMHVYKKQMQLAQAEAISDQISFQMAHSLEKAVAFGEETENDTLFYLEEVVSEDEKEVTLEDRKESLHKSSLSLEDLDLELTKDYDAELGFSDTEPDKAVVWIKIFCQGEEILSRKLEFPALYGETDQKWDDQYEKEDE